MIASLKSLKMIGLPSSNFSKKTYAQKYAYHAQFEALSLVKNIEKKSTNIYTIKVKNKIFFEFNASQVIHSPFQPTLPLTVALTRLLISSKFIKVLNLNRIVALSLFKLLLNTQLSSHQDILAIMKFQDNTRQPTHELRSNQSTARWPPSCLNQPTA